MSEARSASRAATAPLDLSRTNTLGKLRLDGPQSLFRGRIYWSLVLVAVAGLLAYPAVGSAFMASNLSSFLLNIPLALGLALLWGHCGVLSFGQMGFYGIAAYSYGVLAINFGAPEWSLAAAALALITTTLVGLAFGYFIFYGRVSGWIVPVLTLVFTLVLETFLGQTAGYEWKIGEALLGGYNGMTNIPSLSFAGVELNGFGFSLYVVIVLIAFGCFLGARISTNSHFGHVIVAIREDPERAELLGYDIRKYRLAVFTAASGLAGISGILYVSWGNYITPSSAGLLAATMPVLWVAVGGKASLTAVVLSTVGIEYLSDWLSVYSGEFAFVLMGAILVLGMSFAPDGVVVGLAHTIRRIWSTRDRA